MSKWVNIKFGLRGASHITNLWNFVMGWSKRGPSTVIQRHLNFMSQSQFREECRDLANSVRRAELVIASSAPQLCIDFVAVNNA